jgi:endonuclease III
MIKLFLRVHGVGQNIANMFISLLRRCKDVNFPDIYTTNVKADVHVRRVLGRLGLLTETTDSAVWRTAQRLNPEHPGAIDPALWVIGHDWCHPTRPDCVMCIMRDICAKAGV